MNSFPNFEPFYMHVFCQILLSIARENFLILFAEAKYVASYTARIISCKYRYTRVGERHSREHCTCKTDYRLIQRRIRDDTTKLFQNLLWKVGRNRLDKFGEGAESMTCMSLADALHGILGFLLSRHQGTRFHALNTLRITLIPYSVPAWSEDPKLEHSWSHIPWSYCDMLRWGLDFIYIPEDFILGPGSIFLGRAF